MDDECGQVKERNMAYWMFWYSRKLHICAYNFHMCTLACLGGVGMDGDVVSCCVNLFDSVVLFLLPIVLLDSMACHSIKLYQPSSPNWIKMIKREGKTSFTYFLGPTAQLRTQTGPPQKDKKKAVIGCTKSFPSLNTIGQDLLWLSISIVCC